MFRYRLALAAALALSPLAPVAAQTAPVDRVAVVVSIPTPAKATDAYLRAAMDKSVPQYQAIPGLVRKYFTIGNGTFGGIYYWTNKAAADAWFNETWYARVKQSYGVPAQVTYFTVPLAIDGTHP